MPFRPFNFDPQIMSSLKTLGYETPTAIQEQTIPMILKGKDVLGIAQTGTGKTAAFVLPMLQKLLEGPRARVRGLIIAPTRELAQQTHDAIGQLGKNLGLRSAAIYGGVSMHSQKLKLRRGAEIVVACPGRLLDHLGQGTINLSAVEVVVLDEADQMFDMGFLPNVRQILRELPKRRQSLLFSATMPKDVRQLAEEMLSSPVAVQINNTMPVKSVTQTMYPVPPHLKAELLIKILQTQDVKSALIFTRTKITATRVVQELKDAGYRASSLQGDLSQKRRQVALNDFRSGAVDILVATDVASRGIDVADISHVINFDMPETIEGYTHRIGRTGRASKSGKALSFVTRKDMPKLRMLESVLGSKLKQETIAGFDYQAEGTEAHQRESRPVKKQYGQRRSAAGQPRSTSSHGRSGRAADGENRGFTADKRSKRPGERNTFAPGLRRNAKQSAQQDVAFAAARRSRKAGADDDAFGYGLRNNNPRKPAGRSFVSASSHAAKRGHQQETFSVDRDDSPRSRRSKKAGSAEGFAYEPRSGTRKPTGRSFSAGPGHATNRSNRQDRFADANEDSPFAHKRRSPAGGQHRKGAPAAGSARATARKDSDGNDFAGSRSSKSGPRAGKRPATAATEPRRNSKKSAVKTSGTADREQRGSRPVKKSSQTGNFSAKSGKGPKKTTRTRK